MSSTALVSTRVFVGSDRKCYAFSRDDVQMMWLVYRTFDEQTKNRIHSLRIEAASMNWLLFKHWFKQFEGAPLETVAQISHEIAEDAIFHIAMKRLCDREFVQRDNQAITNFFNWLEHEPVDE